MTTTPIATPVTPADAKSSTAGGAAERVARMLRQRITAGELTPGMQLYEETLAPAVEASRNTLREAFRLLCHERLLVHEFHHGVFVRTLSESDVADLYTVRRLIECAAVRSASMRDHVDLAPLSDAVAQGRRALARRQWRALGTADLSFHHQLAGLAESSRISDMMSGLLAELRLAFYVMSDARSFHKPYLDRNRAILDLLLERRYEEAEVALRTYLDDAEAQLLAAGRDSGSSR